MTPHPVDPRQAQLVTREELQRIALDARDRCREAAMEMHAADADPHATEETRREKERAYFKAIEAWLSAKEDAGLTDAQLEAILTGRAIEACRPRAPPQEVA